MKSPRTSNEYKLIFSPDHPSAMFSENWQGYVYEHILVAEERLGRKITSDECVHHLDLDRSNNHPNNLLVMLKSEHLRLHAWLRNGSPVCQEHGEKGINSAEPITNRTLYCKICNAPITTYGSKTYCSFKCSVLGSRKVERPSKEQLAEDIDNLNWTAIGKKYGVSDNAVRKWAKKYGLLDKS